MKRPPKSLSALRPKRMEEINDQDTCGDRPRLGAHAAPGLALADDAAPAAPVASAMKSATVLTGSEAGTTMMLVSRMTPATGTVSRMKSNGSFL